MMIMAGSLGYIITGKKKNVSFTRPARQLLDMVYISDFLSYLRPSAVYGRWFLPLFCIEVYEESSLFSPKVGVNLFRDIL